MLQESLSPEAVARQNGHNDVALFLSSLSKRCELNAFNRMLELVDTVISSAMDTFLPFSLSDFDDVNKTDDCPDLIPLPNIISSASSDSDDSSETVFSVSDEISLGKLFSQDEVLMETDVSKSLLRPLDFSVINITDADHPILQSLSGTEKSQASSHASEVGPALGKSRWEVVVDDFSGCYGDESKGERDCLLDLMCTVVLTSVANSKKGVVVGWCNTAMKRFLETKRVQSPYLSIADMLMLVFLMTHSSAKIS